MNEGEENIASKGKEKPLHSGHRQRMLERLMESDESFQNHEILEVLLYNAIPRSNTNPIAHALINAFGSLAEVFRASVEELMLVDGVGKRTAEYIRCIGICFEKVDPSKQRLPVFSSTKQISDFIEDDYRSRVKESLEIFCLDKQCRLRFRKEFSIGNSSEVTIDPKQIGMLLDFKATNTVVVAHNHPHDTRDPSFQDDVFTKQLLIMCRLHNVKLGDHIVIGRDGVFSYHTTGRLDKLKRSCTDISFYEGCLL